ncbi:hypothetical protein LTR27_001302 [Elasticomyces elasticus]|nr:hypothetical protein LTR27_001302 [Elasticomyces elasticus]
MARTKQTSRGLTGRKRSAPYPKDRPMKRLKVSFTETIEVHVGQAKTKMYIHPSMISSLSPFFDAALKRWKENGEPIIIDDESALFTAYLECLYAQSVTIIEEEEPRDEVARQLKLYIFADKMGDLTTANTVIDRIAFVLFSYYSLVLEDLLETWESTPPTSPLRRLTSMPLRWRRVPMTSTKNSSRKPAPRTWDWPLLAAWQSSQRIAFDRRVTPTLESSAGSIDATIISTMRCTQVARAGQSMTGKGIIGRKGPLKHTNCRSE